MSVARLSLQKIITQIRIALGERTAGQSKLSDGEIVDLVNSYGNTLPSRVQQEARQMGLEMEGHPMWRTSGAVTVSGSTVTMPADFSRPVSFFDDDLSRPIPFGFGISKWMLFRLKNLKPGPPKFIELLGTASDGSRTGTIYPTPLLTPTITAVYYRIPAQMPNVDAGNEYPDADPQFHQLWIIGPMLAILAPDDPMFGRYQEMEKELLRSIVVG